MKAIKKMKNKMLILIFLFTLVVYSQSNIAVVSADKMNIVYRGISNPISIAVSNCKSFTATGNGLHKNKHGTYELNPGQGLESIITVKIILKNGVIKKEQHKFKIKNLPKSYGSINGLICNQSIILMSKKELKNAIISIDFPKDFLYELKLNLEQFTVKIEENYTVIQGNKLTKEVLEKIEELPLNSIFEILNFIPDIHCDNCCFSSINPLKIMIIEDKNNQE